MQSFYDRNHTDFHQFVETTLKSNAYVCPRLLSWVPQLNLVGSRLTSWLMPAARTGRTGGQKPRSAAAATGTGTATGQQQQETLSFVHESFLLEDGGTVCTFTYSPPEDNKTGESPILFFLPTFNTNAFAFQPFITCLVQLLHWTVIVFHRRAIHCPVTSPLHYWAGNDADLHVVIQHLEKKLRRQQDNKSRPPPPVFALGQSAGGCLLLRYLGKYQPTLFCGAAVISSAWHSDMFRQMPRLLAQFILNGVKNRASKYYHSNKTELSEHQQRIYKEMFAASTPESFVMKESLLYECDEKRFLSEWSVENYLDKIVIPTMLINAQDNPICSNPQGFTKLLANNRNLLLVVTDRGSHCGFVHSMKPYERLNWAERISLLFFQSLRSSCSLV